jgi:Ca2+-transporting ATPase
VTSERLASDVLTGLTTAEARARLETDGFNELPAERRRPLWRIAVGVMREPMFALLMRRQRCS